MTLVLSDLWLLRFPIPSSGMLPEPWEEGYGTDVLFVAEDSTDISSCTLTSQPYTAVSFTFSRMATVIYSPENWNFDGAREGVQSSPDLLDRQTNQTQWKIWKRHISGSAALSLQTTEDSLFPKCQFNT